MFYPRPIPLHIRVDKRVYASGEEENNHRQDDASAARDKREG